MSSLHSPKQQSSTPPQGVPPIPVKEPLTRDSLISLLNSEIEELQTENTKSGWSLWAILAAFVGALWVLSDDLKIAAYNPANVLKIFLAWVVLADILYLSYRWLAFTPEVSDGEARFYWGQDLFSTTRLQSVFALGRTLFLIVLVLFSSALTWYQIIPFLVGYLLLSVPDLVSLILPVLAPRFVYPTNPPRASMRAANIFLSVFLLSLLTFLAFLIQRLRFPAGEAIADYRVGGLLAALMILLDLLVRILSTPHKLRPLINIRRKLALGKVSIEEAALQTDVILGGMRSIDALRDNFINLNNLLDMMDEVVQRASTTLPPLAASIPNPDVDDEVTKKEKINTYTAVEGGYRYFLGEREKLLARYSHELSEYTDKIKWIMRGGHSDQQIINQLGQHLKSKGEAIDQRFFSLVSQHDEIQGRAGKYLADRSRTPQ
ncbi:MAG: hypothetical protein M3362_01470 [Acidobacteriota bacterium]|nr:hypothetical protein [Acidobacteriota bacterium]